MTTRRNLLRTAALTPIAFSLGACASSTTTATLDSQVLADAAGITNMLATDLPLLVKIDPNLLPASTQATILSDLKLAQTALSSLSATTPAAQGASTLATVNNYLNFALDALQPVLPVAAVAFPPLAPFVPIVDAAIALAPGIETFVNSLIPSSTPTTAATMRLARLTVAGAPLMTPITARALLRIPTVQ